MTALEGVLNRGMSGIDLSDRSSTKFNLLASLLAELWQIPVEAIGVKALSAAKNYGNRISEATRAPLQILVLVTKVDCDRDAVARALEGRSLLLVPTLFVVEAGGRWTVDCCYLSDGVNNPFGAEVHSVVVSRRTPGLPGVASLARAKADLLSCHGRVSPADLRAMITNSGEVASLVTVKQITETRHLGNRIGEALGRRPPILAIVVHENLASATRRFLRLHKEASRDTSVFIICDASGVVSVGSFDPNHESGCPTENGEPALSGENDDAKHAEDRHVSSQGNQRNNDDSIYKRLNRVEQLAKLLPLDSQADHLYEEHLDTDDRLTYETKTLGYLRGLLGETQRVFIVLTGNAGHGKTHMCRRLLESGEMNSDVMSGLESDTKGERDWRVLGASLPVRVVKDLSELSLEEEGAARLEALMLQEVSHVIVCANEGRLRDVVGRQTEHLGVLIRALERGIERGETSPSDDSSVYVVNLNYQAAVSKGGGFLNHVLDHFLNLQTAWNVCTKCAARDQCPILANRNDLTMSPSAPQLHRERREAFTDLVRIAEESGYVLTYRDTLVLVAYTVTGGITCEDVERLHQRRTRSRARDRKLEDYRLLELLFDPQLSDDEFEILRVLKTIGRLDPGLVALRSVDERLHAELEESGDLGNALFGDEARNLHQRAELHREETSHRKRLRQARRAAWLVSVDEQDGVTRSERLGLRHHRRFRALQDSPDLGVVLDAIRTLVKGLHTIQGASGAKSMSSMHLVDPAFGRSGSHTAVIARSIKINDLELWAESDWWRHCNDGETPAILDSVEWLNRHVVLVHRPSLSVLLLLDLSTFEFVMSSATGIVMREFHSAERRRILRSLARHAERDRGSEGVVRVLLERGEGEITIERDQTILLETN